MIDMKNRLALTVVFAVFAAFLFWFVSVRQSLLFIVGIGLVQYWPERALVLPAAGVI